MVNINEKSNYSNYPLISVIVPVYNAALYLIRSINSIRYQTYSNLEIILINDGSTDSSGEICNELASKDSRIKVLNQLNSGSSIARNKGLKIAKGEYISFVDSDDWIELNMFETMVSYAREKQLKLVECGSIESVENREEISSKYDKIIEEREVALERIIKNLLFAVWRRIYHISLVKNDFFIPHKIHQDVFYTIDILNKIDRIGFINYPFYNYNTENNTSIIRGKYTLKKLKAIDAGLYVVNETNKYNSKINFYARKYLIKFLTLHYDALFSNDFLDEDYIHRKEIKKLVSKNLKKDNFTLYGFLLKVLPFPCYSIFLKVNKYRINLQQQFLMSIKNVKG